MPGMEELRAFIVFPWQCCKWACSIWLRKFLNVWSILLLLLLLLTGLGIHRLLNASPWGFEKFLGDPMAALMNALVYVIGAPVVVYGGALLIFLVAAPSQLLLDKVRKIKELTPPDLDLVWSASESSKVQNRLIGLDGASLIHKSTAHLNLSFTLYIDYLRNDGQKDRLQLLGTWMQGTQIYTEHLDLNGRKNLHGQVVFHLPVESKSGITEWQFSLKNDCVLEIKDAYTGMSLGCNPILGTPISLPLAPLSQTSVAT